MAGYGVVAVLFLAGWAFLSPASMSWGYIGASLVFELWLMRRIAGAGSAPVAAGEPPYDFSAQEAELVGRYRFYFMYPALARNAASVLAALGLTALVLAPWLTYKQAFLQAAIVGLNLFAVGRLTKQLVPLMALRIPASRGDRDALRLLEAFDPAWAKIRTANEAQDRAAEMR